MESRASPCDRGGNTSSPEGTGKTVGDAAENASFGIGVLAAPIPLSITVVSVIIYGILSTGYETFHGELGISPKDV
jgi:hypothetical protein